MHVSLINLLCLRENDFIIFVNFNGKNVYEKCMQWANCGIAKHHGSLVTEQNFAKHGDQIFSSTGSFINSNLWKIQIIVQLNLNFQEICTSCSMFVRSFWFIQANDSEIFNMPYRILEMRNDHFSN